MADWTFLHDYKGTDTNIEGVVRQVTGNPIYRYYVLDPGNEGCGKVPAGRYLFTFDTNTSVICTVFEAENKWQEIATGPITVVCDRVTENLNLLPGWSFVFDSMAVASNQFEVIIGGFKDDFVYIPVLAFNERPKGLPGTLKEIIVQNISGETLTDCQAVVTNLIVVVNAGIAETTPFFAFWQSGLLNPTADEDNDGLAVTFDNYTAGSPATVDILIDGKSPSVYDVTNSVFIPDGKTLNCDGVTAYRFADAGDLQSGMFILSENLQETDTATIYVLGGGDQIEIAVDDDYIRAAIEITEDGQEDGVVTDDGKTSFNLRMNPIVTADTILRFGFSVRVQGVKVDGSTVEHSISGNLSLLDLEIADSFLWNIQAIKGQYAMPTYAPEEHDTRYSLSDPGPPAVYVEDDPFGLYIEDPESPGEYILADGTVTFSADTGGLYVKNPQNPTGYILASEETNEGNYPAISDILAENGIRFTVL